jgi:hypothetical protein
MAMNKLIPARIITFLFALSALPQVTEAETGDFWVGILPIESNCPAASFKVSFYLDAEDAPCGLLPVGVKCTGLSWLVEGFDSDWTERSANWMPFSGTSGKMLGGTGYRFTWCRVDGEKFTPMTTDPFDTSNAYSVLKLSANCPPGSQDRGIYIDTEDDDDNNSHSGNISPNTVNANATLRFCQFRSTSAAVKKMSFPVFKDSSGASVSYGVLHDFDGAQPSWVLNKKYVYFNDENDSNESKYLEKPPPTLLTLDPYATFTTMIQGYKGGLFFEFAQVR